VLHQTLYIKRDVIKWLPGFFLQTEPFDLELVLFFGHGIPILLAACGILKAGISL
jgi:hypothetical protein